MTDNDIKIVCEKIESLHEKILKSKFAETVTESEMLSLILAVNELNSQTAEIERLNKAYIREQEIFSEQCLENERLKVTVDRLEAMIDAVEEHFAPLPFKNKFDEYIEKCEVKAIRKFADRLVAIYENDKTYDRPNAHTLVMTLFRNIDNLVEEMERTYETNSI